MAHPRILDRDQSVLVVVDVQEAYRGRTVEYERMLQGVRRLVQAAQIVNVPVLATEQYPKGLGHVVAEIAEALPASVGIVEKISLSCCGEPRFVERLSSFKRNQVLVCGI